MIHPDEFPISQAYTIFTVATQSYHICTEVQKGHLITVWSTILQPSNKLNHTAGGL